MIASYQVFTTFTALLFLPSNSLCWALTHIFYGNRTQGKNQMICPKENTRSTNIQPCSGDIGLGFLILKADNM